MKNSCNRRIAKRGTDPDLPMTPSRSVGPRIFTRTVYVRVPPAAEGCDCAVEVSAAEFMRAVESDTFTTDSYETWTPNGRVITADRLRDHRHRQNPKRPVPSPSVVKNLLTAQAEMITIHRLLGRVAAGTDTMDALPDLVAWMRDVTDYFEQLTRDQAKSIAPALTPVQSVAATSP